MEARQTRSRIRRMLPAAAQVAVGVKYQAKEAHYLLEAWRGPVASHPSVEPPRVEGLGAMVAQARPRETQPQVARQRPAVQAVAARSAKEAVAV